MSRLDRHVTFVQGKLTTSAFIDSLSATVAAFFVAVSVAIILNRTVQLALPHPQIWLAGALGIAILAALIVAAVHRPSAHQAAVEIDRRLGLKEKFSTALYVRASADPFAVAAVRDAELAAENVSLYRRFPFTRPRYLWAAVATAIVTGLLLWTLPSMDLLGREAQQKKLAEAAQKRAAAKEVVRQALATVNSYPKSLFADRDIQLAKRDLQALMNQPITDPERTGRSAMKALNDAEKAVQEQIKNSEKFATAQNEQQTFAQMNTPSNEKGPVASASRAIAHGDFSKAADDLKHATKQFSKMTPAQQKTAARQMQALAQQLKKMAADPTRQQELQQKLQQMGATQQQAKQMQQMMQQAAQGNPQAQQQLQQLKKQLMKQMNNGQGPSPQQMQQMQQTMNQMQASANTQQTAQQMSQAALRMAHAMQQAQSSQQAGGTGKQGQMSGQQQAQQMTDARQQMQQQMDQMDAIAQDAKEVAAADQATNQASQDAADQASGQSSANGSGNKPGQGGGWGQWKAGKNGNGGHGGGGAGGPGPGGGKADGITEAPFAMKAEIAPSKNIATGRILASSFVKAGDIKGNARAGLSKVAASALQDSTDDVNEQNISKQSQDVVKRYFQTMQDSK